MTGVLICMYLCQNAFSLVALLYPFLKRLSKIYHTLSQIIRCTCLTFLSAPCFMENHPICWECLQSNSLPSCLKDSKQPYSKFSIILILCQTKHCLLFLKSRAIQKPFILGGKVLKGQMAIPILFLNVAYITCKNFYRKCILVMTNILFKDSLNIKGNELIQEDRAMPAKCPFIHCIPKKCISSFKLHCYTYSCQNGINFYALQCLFCRAKTPSGHLPYILFHSL